ncbi:hypothetical protein CDCA_CDCA08G2437 [Cyanidium caldarium]|uniref:Leucine-rich repeat domain-containing protein n=1 Tax=Cyanidium caldarium TaxID=2771 RepID=A0AAV9IVQ2_CYACA|nr:hypothetical protein CDCA_CDCA08G2437 [Cyanidium caldarium]
MAGSECRQKVADDSAADNTSDSAEASARRRLTQCLDDGLGIVDLSHGLLDDTQLRRVWEVTMRQRHDASSSTTLAPVWCLKLAHNRLQRFPAWLVQLFRTHLRILDLSHNRLRSPLHGLRLASVPRLEVLSLSHNAHIDALPADWTAELPSTEPHPLCALDVSHNRLSHIDDACHPTAAQLRILNASYNDIERLPDRLGEWRSLRSLDLRGNARLALLPPSARQLPEQLMRVDLQGTPLGDAFIPSRIRSEGVREHGPMAIVRWLAGRSEEALHPSPTERARLSKALRRGNASEKGQYREVLRTLE